MCFQVGFKAGSPPWQSAKKYNGFGRREHDEVGQQFTQYLPGELEDVIGDIISLYRTLVNRFTGEVVDAVVTNKLASSGCVVSISIAVSRTPVADA